MKNFNKDKFGILVLIALVVGNTIGAGIFMLPATLAKIGSISLLSWILTATGSLLFAFVFAKMSQMVLTNGGPYAYAKTGLGEFIGFQVAFTFWISLWTGNSSLVVTLVGYLRTFYPEITSFQAILIGWAIIWTMVGINVSGLRPIGKVQILTTIIKLLPIILVIGIGCFFFHPAYITESFNVSGQSNFHAFSYAATLTLWGFVGIEAACVPTWAIKNPKHNIRLAMIIGTIILAVIYIAASLLVMGMFPNQVLAHSSSPFAAAAQMVFGSVGQFFVVVCIVISCLGALNSGLFLEGQVPMAAADDGLFPKIFSKRNKAGIPGWGLAIDATLMCGFIALTSKPSLIDQFQLVVTIAAVMTLIAYLYSAIAEIVLLADKDKIAYKKINILVAVLAAIYAFWAIFGSGKEIMYYTTMLIFASSFIYVILYWRRKR